MSGYLVTKLLPKLLQQLLPNSKAAAKPVMQQCKQKRWKWTFLDGSGSDATAEALEALEALKADLFGWKQKRKRKQLKGTAPASTAKYAI